MKNKNNYTLLIIIVVILLSLLGIIYFTEDNEEIIQEKANEYVLLNDYSRFFTINSCVYKYITYITSNKIEDLINVLDDDYKKDNNITSSNVYNYINKLNGNYSFKSKKIYYEKENSNVIKYYVYGDLIKEIMDANGEYTDYYLIVNLDLKNQLFSVTPYDGKIFKEVK